MTRLFHPPDVALASGSLDKTLALWDIATGEQLRFFSGHTRYVTTVSFSPDGKILASGSLDGVVRLWRVDGSLPITPSDHGSRL